jgi:pilus assembly protein Flp/PilA
MKGQSLAEYALVLILVAIVVIVMLALLGPTMGNLFSNKVNPCVYEQSFECKDQRVNQCMQSESYSRDECIALIGGGGQP